MNYDDWLKSLPTEITDTVWGLPAKRATGTTKAVMFCKKTLPCTAYD